LGSRKQCLVRTNRSVRYRSWPLSILNVRRPKIKDCRAVYPVNREKKRTRHAISFVYLYYVRWIPGIVRGYGAPDTLASLCFVDDFTRVGHLRRDKPDNGRSNCPRKTVSQSHLSPLRINEKTRPSILRRRLSDLTRDFLGYLSTQTSCILRIFEYI